MQIATPQASLPASLKLLERIRSGDVTDPPKSNQTCIVAFSGGKDSWACLELAVRVFGRGNVHVYNLYIVPELECELRELRKAERRYAVVIRRLPHPGLHTALSAGHLQPLPTGFRRKLHHSDIYELIRDVTRSDWLIFGHRMDESLQRRGMIKASGGLMTRLRKAYPIWNWKAADVFHFLKASKIPLPEQWTEDDTTGMTLGPQTLLYLKAKYPDDYRKVVSLFPLAEVQFLREKQRMDSGLEPSHYSIKRKKGLMETLNEYLEDRIKAPHVEVESEASQGVIASC